MEDYIVSARKYRPSTFASVIGQHALTTTLKNAIGTGKLAQAYLFCGPRGVGKTTCARIFAKTINCLTPTADGEACNECESCRAFNEQRSYNIHELDAASNNSVEDIRQLVEQVRIPPQIGHYKVYIIDEVHMLSQSAFNAFLKTLEEPPRHAVFILATTEKQKILPTILSRCQIYDFNRIGVADIADHLAHVAAQEHIEAEPQALNVIAQKADGGMRDALSIFDQTASFCQGHITYSKVIENLNVLDYEYYFRLTDHLLHGNITGSLLLFNEVLNKGFDAGEFITGLGSHLRDVMVSKDPETVQLLEVSPDVAQRYQAQAQACPLPFLYKAMKLCCDSSLNYRNSRNKRFLVECTLIQLGQIAEGDEAPGSGQGPAQEIKPVFGASTGTVRGAAPAQQATQPAMSTAIGQTGANEAATQPTPQAIQSGALNTSPAPQVPQAVTNATPAAQTGTRSTNTVRVKGRGGFGLSMSIKRTETEEAQSAQTTNEVLAPYQPTAPQAIVTEDNMRAGWLKYATSLPHEEVALSTRMRSMAPVLLPGNIVEVSVENELVAKEIENIAPAMNSFLQRELRNSQVRLSVVIKKTQRSNRALTQREQLQLMMEKNGSLLTLAKELGLTL